MGKKERKKERSVFDIKSIYERERNIYILYSWDEFYCLAIVIA
jgi:hypothetical protein